MTRLSDRGYLSTRSLSYTFTGTATQLDAALPITHALGSVANSLELWVEQTAGVWEKHDPSAYIFSSATQLVTSGGPTLASVVGGSTNVRLVASSGAVAVSVQEATATQAGIVSTTTQTFAGDKTFLGALTLGPPVVGGVNGVAHLVRTGDQGTTFNVSSANAGTIQFANAAVSAASPLIAGTTNDAGNAHGLFIGAFTNDGTTGGDMCFDVRENDNTDFATTANNAFVWRRFGNTLMSTTRAGSVTLGPSGLESSTEHHVNGVFEMISGSVSVANNTTTTLFSLNQTIFRNRMVYITVWDIGARLGGGATIYCTYDGGTYIHYSFTQTATGASTSTISFSSPNIRFLHTQGTTRTIYYRCFCM